MLSPAEINPYAAPAAAVDVVPQAPAGDEQAPRIVRLLAWFVDLLLFVAAGLPGYLLMQFLGGDEPILMLASALVFQSYQWYRIATTGQSVAKRWFDLRIVRMDGSRCGFVHGVVMRNWSFYSIYALGFLGAALLPFLWTIDYLLILGDGRRCLHDIVAGTRVLYAPPAPGP